MSVRIDTIRKSKLHRYELCGCFPLAVIKRRRRLFILLLLAAAVFTVFTIGTRERRFQPVVNAFRNVDVYMLTVPEQAASLQDVYDALVPAAQQMGYRTYLLNFPDCVQAPNPWERCTNDSSSTTGVVPRRPRIYVTASFCNLDEENVLKLPQKTVIWQLEALSDARSTCLNSTTHRNILSGSIIWDYSRVNMRALRANFGAAPVLHHAPFYWYPGVTSADWSAPPPPEARERREDIDVVFIGWVHGKRRPPVIHELARRNVSVHHDPVNGFKREEILARAKIVLNIHFYESKLLETVRLHYLLSQRRFVISEVSSDPEADADYGDAVVFTSYRKIVATVQKWLREPAARRHEVADRGYDYMRSKSMAEVYGPYLEEAERLMAT